MKHKWNLDGTIRLFPVRSSEMNSMFVEAESLQLYCSFDQSFRSSLTLLPELYRNRATHEMWASHTHWQKHQQKCVCVSVCFVILSVYCNAALCALFLLLGSKLDKMSINENFWAFLTICHLNCLPVSTSSSNSGSQLPSSLPHSLARKTASKAAGKLRTFVYKCVSKQG